MNQTQAIKALRDALTFYAEQQHFVLHEDVFDTISGEPQNWQEDESNTIMFEDGSVAKQALALTADASEDAPDAVVEANRELLRRRSDVGVRKYGVTLADANLTEQELTTHALEEALDLANYLQALLQKSARPAPVGAVQAKNCEGCRGYGMVGNIIDQDTCPFCQGTGEAAAPAAPAESKSNMQNLHIPTSVNIARAATKEITPFSIMGNVRRLLSEDANRGLPNWVLACTIFAMGKNPATRVCQEAGIDPHSCDVKKEK